MAIKKVNRHEVLRFLNVGTTVAPDFKIVGIGIEDMGTDLNPQTETTKWVINKGANSELTGYQPTSSVSQKCYIGDPVFEMLNEFRRILAVGDEAKSQVLDVDVYDSKKATLFDCTIAIDTYMSSEADISYTINYNGDPVQGTATLDKSGGATFTPDLSV